jgi:ribosomal protein S10
MAEDSLTSRSPRPCPFNKIGTEFQSHHLEQSASLSRVVELFYFAGGECPVAARQVGLSRARILLMAVEPEWTCALPVSSVRGSIAHRAPRRIATMKGSHRRPDFSVVVWIKKNEHFPALRSEVLAAAGAEPYEMTEYQRMADFHWATSSVVDAHKLAEALKVVCQRPEVVLLRIISLVDDVESISIKDERITKH